MSGVKRISTGSRAIDDLLGGGIEAGTITQLYGEPASGKTNICLQLSVIVSKAGKKVIYIDTEGFSPERFQQISGGDLETAKKLARNLIHFQPMSFEQQYEAIRESEKLAGKDIGLIVLDSATAFYRVELEGADSIALKRKLAYQVTMLLSMARRHDIPVIITNQIYMDIDKDELKAAGGNMLEHISKAIVQLCRTGPGKRVAVIKKHRSMAEGRSAEFSIVESGVE